MTQLPLRAYLNIPLHYFHWIRNHFIWTLSLFASLSLSIYTFVFLYSFLSSYPGAIVTETESGRGSVRNGKWKEGKKSTRTYRKCIHYTRNHTIPHIIHHTWIHSHTQAHTGCRNFSLKIIFFFSFRFAVGVWWWDDILKYLGQI